MSSIKYLKSSVALLVVFFATCASALDIGLCKFGVENMQFRGGAGDQVSCLLRHVKPRGAGSTAQVIPSWLLSNVGKPNLISPQQMSSYLAAIKVQPSQVGVVVSSIDLAQARYFVIHDTSSPVFEKFPSDINDLAWSGNDLRRFKTSEVAKKVHVVTNRVGDSLTLQDLAVQRKSPATKLEESGVVPKSRNYFIHVENVQPREQPAGSWPWVAPNPAFTSPQVKRLALIYVVSSVRAGRWLIPAYHFNVDSGATPKEPHDDPQGFNLDGWVNEVSSIVDDIQLSKK